MPLAQPAKIGGERQQQKQRLAHRARQMRHRTVDRNHRIQASDDGCRIGKVAEASLEPEQIGKTPQHCSVFIAYLVLKTDEFDIRHIK